MSYSDCIWRDAKTQLAARKAKVSCAICLENIGFPKVEGYMIEVIFTKNINFYANTKDCANNLTMVCKNQGCELAAKNNEIDKIAAKYKCPKITHPVIKYVNSCKNSCNLWYEKWKVSIILIILFLWYYTLQSITSTANSRIF